MRFPWNGIIVDGIKLDREQEQQFLKEVKERVRVRRMMSRSSILWFVIVFLIILVSSAIGGFFGIIANSFTLTTRLPLALVVFGGIALIGCILSVRLRRHIFARHMRQTMQTLGYELCLACGYWLKGLDDTTDRCPECGTKREPLPESTPEERDALT